MTAGNGVDLIVDRLGQRDERAASRRAPRSPITASRTPAGARRAADALLCTTPDSWRFCWRDASAIFVLAPVLEAAAVARAGSRSGHAGLPTASLATVRRWLDSLAVAVPVDLVEVLAAGINGTFGPDAQQSARHAGRSLVELRSRFDQPLRETLVSCDVGP
jgi:hypothetical protein